MSADEIVILRIELEDIEPAIWRRVAVRDATSLAGLHRIIQAAMGWLDYHLWEFEISDTTYGVPDPDGFDGGRESRPATGTKLGTILNRGIDEFTYTYDMGNNWCTGSLWSASIRLCPIGCIRSSLEEHAVVHQKIAAASQATTPSSTPSPHPTKVGQAARRRMRSTVRRPLRSRRHR